MHSMRKNMHWRTLTFGRSGVPIEMHSNVVIGFHDAAAVAVELLLVFSLLSFFLFFFIEFFFLFFFVFHT
jgi:hypothetical protein